MIINYKFYEEYNLRKFMEKFKGKIGEKKIKRYAIANFNQNIDQNLNLYQSCSIMQPKSQMIDQDNTDIIKTQGVSFDKTKYIVKYTQSEKSHTSCKYRINLPDNNSLQQYQASQIQHYLTQNNSRIRSNNCSKKLIPLTSNHQQNSQGYTFKDNLQKNIEQFRNIKLERQKKKINNNLSSYHDDLKTSSKGHNYRKMNRMQSLDNKTSPTAKGRRSFKKIPEMHKNQINPHFIEMQIGVDPQSTINGIRKIPSMNLDRSLFGNNFFLQCARKNFHIMNAKNTYQPVFRAHTKQKSEQFSSKEDYSKKIQHFFGKKQDLPLKITYSEHLKMKQEAYRRKQQQILSKNNNLFMNQDNLFACRSKRNKQQSKQSIQNGCNRSSQKQKKKVNVVDIKNYQELIRTQNVQTQNKNILKNKMNKDQSNEKKSLIKMPLNSHQKKVSFSGWSKSLSQSFKKLRNL